jgi:Nucleotidyl transferase AbiEii toxin, Type IV TA system
VSIDDTELYDTADAFGVDLDQVRRDHVISHVLAAISTHARDTFLFTGGTMLSRTWLRDVRLSEDVDLMVYETRSVVGARLADLVRSEIEPLFGRVEWDKDPATAGDAESIFASVGDDVTIKFQLVDTIGRAPWPRARVAIHQRYSDAPPSVRRWLTSALSTASIPAPRTRQPGSAHLRADGPAKARFPRSRVARHPDWLLVARCGRIPSHGRLVPVGSQP